MWAALARFAARGAGFAQKSWKVASTSNGMKWFSKAVDVGSWGYLFYDLFGSEGSSSTDDGVIGTPLAERFITECYQGIYHAQRS
jgi:hypothetical protein